MKIGRYCALQNFLLTDVQTRTSLASAVDCAPHKKGATVMDLALSERGSSHELPPLGLLRPAVVGVSGRVVEELSRQRSIETDAVPPARPVLFSVPTESMQAGGGGLTRSTVPALEPGMAGELKITPVMGGVVWGAASLGSALAAPLGGAAAAFATGAAPEPRAMA